MAPSIKRGHCSSGIIGGGPILILPANSALTLAASRDIGDNILATQNQGRVAFGSSEKSREMCCEETRPRETEEADRRAGWPAGLSQRGLAPEAGRAVVPLLLRKCDPGILPSEVSKAHSRANSQ